MGRDRGVHRLRGRGSPEPERHRRQAGTATESTGHALAAIGSLPLVGGRISHLAAQAIAAGASARASGASTASTVDQLAILLGVAIALVPTVPLLALYVPLALSWRRDRKAVRRALAQWDGEPELEAFLAHRALAHLRFDELRALGYGTQDSPPNAELAAAELRRLGLERPARRVEALRRPPGTGGPVITRQRRRPGWQDNSVGPAEPPPAGRVARVYAGVVIWLAPLLVVLVAAAAYGAYHYLPSFSTAPTATSDSLLPKHPARFQVETARIFGSPLATPYAVVQRDPNGLSEPVQRASLAKAVAVDRNRVPSLRGIKAVPIVNTLGIVPSSREHGTTIVTYLYFPHETASGLAYAEAPERYAQYLGPRLHTVGATGAEAARIQQYSLLAGRLHWVEGLTVLLIVLIVGIALRAVLAPILTVLCAGIAFLISQRLLGWLEANSNLTMPNELQGVAVALMLGVVTDYSIFYFSTAREALRDGLPAREAVRRSTVLNTPIVFTAGAVVSFGVASLLLGTLAFFHSFGPGMAVTVATGLLVSVLFVPAMLRLLGPALFWPGLRRGTPPVRKWRTRASHLATRKPVSFVFAAAAVAALVLAASGLRNGLPLGLQLVEGLPSSNPVAVSAHAAGKGFARE